MLCTNTNNKKTRTSIDYIKEQLIILYPSLRHFTD